MAEQAKSGTESDGAEVVDLVREQALRFIRDNPAEADNDPETAEIRLTMTMERLRWNAFVMKCRQDHDL